MASQARISHNGRRNKGGFMVLWQKLALALTLATSTVAANADPVVYVIGDGGQFGTINLSTGSFTAIGPGLSVGTGGLARGPGGSLLSLGFNGNLNSINPATGVLSTVGATGLGDCTLPTSACGSNSANVLGSVGSSLFATDLANNLYSIDPVTGAATLIGATGIPPVPFIPHAAVPGDPDGSFYIYDESLFSYGGQLYANMDAGIFDPVTFTPTSLVAPNIYQINTSTGAATVVASTDFGLGAITDVNGTLYAFDLPISSIVTLNLTDGSTTYVSGTDPAAGMVGGVSPVPEPSSLLLVGSGLTAIAAGMRRRFAAR
jgi:PEP-CTERM motif